MNKYFTNHQAVSAGILREDASSFANAYCEPQDLQAETIALLATALEQECIAQGINPARYPIFTTGELE